MKMKQLYSIMLCCCVLFAVGSCKKDRNSPAGILERVKDLQQAGRQEEARRYYTDGTRDALVALIRENPGLTEAHLGIDRFFAKGAEWDVVKESQAGDRAEVAIQYTAFPGDTMKGFTMTFHFKREDGTWKLDFEREIEHMSGRGPSR